MSRWARTRITDGRGTGVSLAGGNGPEMVGWRVGSIKEMVGLRPALVGLGVSECALIDSTHSHTQHTQSMSRA